MSGLELAVKISVMEQDLNFRTIRFGNIHRARMLLESFHLMYNSRFWVINNGTVKYIFSLFVNIKGLPKSII